MAYRIVFATGNKGKMREIREIMADFDIEILSMAEAGVETDVVEDGTTFMENSFIKARAIADKCRKMGYTQDIVLADDSGLVVDALGGEPGIFLQRTQNLQVYIVQYRFTHSISRPKTNLFFIYFL